MTGPLAGFMLDVEARALRPVLGVPGAAHAGAAVLGDVEAMAVAPQGDVALAATAEGLALVRRLKTGEFETLPIENGLVGATRLAWSADGSFAAAYAAAGGAAQVLRGSQVERTVDVSALEGVTALAIDNTGKTLIVGAVGGVYIARSSGLELAGAIAGATGIAISGGSAFIAADAVYELADVAGKATLLPFAAEAAAGVAVSGNGKRLLIAAAESVAVYDIASRALLSRTELGWAPATLARFGAPATFLLKPGQPGSEPLYVVDATAEPAVFFVPAGREQ
jgi:hypothetical protein